VFIVEIQGGTGPTVGLGRGDRGEMWNSMSQKSVRIASATVHLIELQILVQLWWEERIYQQYTGSCSLPAGIREYALTSWAKPDFLPLSFRDWFLNTECENLGQLPEYGRQLPDFRRKLDDLLRDAWALASLSLCPHLQTDAERGRSLRRCIG